MKIHPIISQRSFGEPITEKILEAVKFFESSIS